MKIGNLINSSNPDLINTLLNKIRLSSNMVDLFFLFPTVYASIQIKLLLKLTMNPSTKRLPPKAAELFQKIHLAHRNRGSNPLISERRTWFEFMRAAHASSNLRLTGGELYVLLTEEYGLRNDLAQSLAAEYDFAMEFMDFLAPHG